MSDVAITVMETLRVDVPVGFLLAETREVPVQVERRDGTPFTIRLRLIPAQVNDRSSGVSEATPLPIRWPKLRTRLASANEFPTHDCGGSD